MINCKIMNHICEVQVVIKNENFPGKMNQINSYNSFFTEVTNFDNNLIESNKLQSKFLSIVIDYLNLVIIDINNLKYFDN